MEFTVPQFIEGKTKIVGPLSFKQLAYLIIAGVACIFLYFAVPTMLFILLFIIIFGSAVALALLKIKGTPLPTLIKNFFIFLTKPKVYLWKKEAEKISERKIKKHVIKKEKTESKIKLTKNKKGLRGTLNKLSIK